MFQMENSYAFSHVLFPFTTQGALSDMMTMLLLMMMITINLWNISIQLMLLK